MKKILALILTLWLSQAFGSDLAKEKRWADQVVDALLDGEAITLNDGTSDFLGIFTEAENAKANVIVLHGIGIHPDWPQIVQPLRVGLAENGYNTLSIQMPILPNEAASKDYAKLMVEVAPRIKAALAYLDKCCKGKTHIAAHSMGARMGAYYLNDNTDSGITSFIAIGMNKNVDIGKIKIPLLDVYGENDLEGVLAAVPARAKILKAPSKQHLIKDADHFMEGQEKDLLNTVSKWLAR